MPTIGGASSTIDTLHFVSAHPKALIERCDLRSALKEYVDILDTEESITNLTIEGLSLELMRII